MTSTFTAAKVVTTLERPACRPDCLCHKSARRGYGVTHCVNEHLHSNGDHSPSLSVNPDANYDPPFKFRCPVCGDTGRPDLIDAMRGRGLLPSPAKKKDSDWIFIESYAWSADVRHYRYLVNGEKRMPWKKKDANGNFRPTDGNKPTGPEYALFNYQHPLPEEPVVVFWLEGEKCVDIARAHGLLATTSGGVGSWTDEAARQLDRYYLIAVPDNDARGIEEARKVIARHDPNRCQLLELPGLGDGEDFEQWMLGRAKADLVGLTGLAVCQVCGGPIAPAQRGVRARTTCSNRCKCALYRRNQNRVAEASTMPKTVLPDAETVLLELDAADGKTVLPPEKTVLPEFNAALSCDMTRKSGRFGQLTRAPGARREDHAPGGLSCPFDSERASGDTRRGVNEGISPSQSDSTVATRRGSDKVCGACGSTRLGKLHDGTLWCWACGACRLPFRDWSDSMEPATAGGS